MVKFLKGVPFFSKVEGSSLEVLCQDLVVEYYEKGDCIIKKDTVGDAMFIIKAGLVKVHDANHQYSNLGPNDCFGEYALIDNEPRSASVTALEECELYKLESKRFVKLIGNDFGFIKGVLSVLIKRHRELDVIQENLAMSKSELERTNAKMSGLINGAMDIIIMFDGNYRILLANPAALKVLENTDVIQRNVLFFFNEPSATILEDLISSNKKGESKGINTMIPSKLKIIGSEGTETTTEGTISNTGSDAHRFYTLILRNLERRLENEKKISELTNQTKYLESEISELTNTYGIVAEDRTMKKVLGAIQQVAITDATVLIQGETGTGKELVARAIHEASHRNEKPLIRINCGAIPANLIESELFGHEKGAFTGATVSRKGRFLLADKGTIFLDEIGELPLELQPKLLRVIQEGEFDPLGSSATIKVDVRIIAATHRDLLKKSKEGNFREDLYYRLNVFPIAVPPLRKRGNDVILIANKMLEHFGKKLGKTISLLEDNAVESFKSYNWPGNVRELQNLIERAVIVSKNGKIDWKLIIPQSNNQSVETTLTDATEVILTSDELVALERENISKALKKCNWRVSGPNGAALLLNIPPTTLSSKIKAFGITRPI
ncbi:sigma 54-interacting transcriptional regulator [Croceivirga thetidis]|uniref:Sigma 54-interacting transcriptional regulator n=1 Tax=Croceivirga thetidis TaxID=2721623 RepID=A0ABX1GVJ8_9FLAO|nr:sigma 54-interacting transcriptional regulator [Croceivirga thetidis]NKI32757.1 sigma 54-interacting transcriptional regulator [Croceivirga thetidis]